MDNAFATAPYPAYTLAQLEALVAEGRGNPVMRAEIDRRKAIAIGNLDLMTASERLHAARNRKI